MHRESEPPSRSEQPQRPRRLNLPRSFRRNARLALVAVALMFLGILFIGGSEGFYVQWQLKRDIERTREENARLRSTIAAEREYIYRLEHDLPTIERLARVRDGMARPGERVYRIVPPTESQTPQR